MNNGFRQKVHRAGRFAGFLLKAGTRHQVHSPFLYKFINEVIRPQEKVEGEKEIEAIRKECLHNREVINKTDYGTGSKDALTLTYPVEIRKIAMTSLSSKRYARRLSRLVRFTGAGKIIEIGTSLGITTAYLAKANPGARIITLEGCPELSKRARSNFSSLGLENITQVEGRFEETLEKALEQLETVDLVYIDGNHRKAALLDYAGRCLAHANNNTVLIVDDIHLNKEMEQGWEELTRHDKVRVSLDLFFSGWILLRQESSPEHFRLRYV